MKLVLVVLTLASSLVLTACEKPVKEDYVTVPSQPEDTATNDECPRADGQPCQ